MDQTSSPRYEPGACFVVAATGPAPSSQRLQALPGNPSGIEPAIGAHYARVSVSCSVLLFRSFTVFTEPTPRQLPAFRNCAPPFLVDAQMVLLVLFDMIIPHVHIIRFQPSCWGLESLLRQWEGSRLFVYRSTGLSVLRPFSWQRLILLLTIWASCSLSSAKNSPLIRMSGSIVLANSFTLLCTTIVGISIFFVAFAILSSVCFPAGKQC